MKADDSSLNDDCSPGADSEFGRPRLAQTSPGVFVAPARFISAVRIYLLAPSELEALPDGDLRDMPITRADVPAVALEDARRRLASADVSWAVASLDWAILAIAPIAGAAIVLWRT
jgi:uncharacterized protein YjiS (DUF1127 family)